MSETITEEEKQEILVDFFKRMNKNPEENIKIVIGEDGCGAVYTLQKLKEEVEEIIKDPKARDFELKYKRLIDRDWVFDLWV